MKDPIVSLLENAILLLEAAMTVNPDDLKVTSSATAGVLTIVKQLAGILSLFGVGMTLIYFLTELNSKIAFEGNNVTLKTLIAPLLKLFAALCILQKAPDIVGAIISVAVGFISSAYSAVTSISYDGSKIQAYVTAMNSEIDGLGVLALVVLLIPIVLAFIIALVCRLIWWYKTITYKIEVLWHITVAPIAFADIYNGLNSSAIRFIKKVIAIGIVGMAMVALPKITMTLGIDAVTAPTGASPTGDMKTLINYFSGFGQLLICPIVALGGVNLVKQVTKEVIGA